MREDSQSMIQKLQEQLREPVRIGRRLGFHAAEGVLIVVLALLASIFEALSLAMMLPVYEFMQGAGTDALAGDRSKIWSVVSAAYKTVGIPISLESLLLTSFVFLGFRQIFRYANLCYTMKSKTDLVRQVRAEGFRRFLAASTEFQGELRVGQIVADLTEELRRAVDNLYGLVSTIGFFGTAMVYFAGMLTLSWEASVISLLIVGCVAYPMKTILRRTQEYGKSVTRFNQETGTFLVERLGHARHIRLSGTERVEQDNVLKLVYLQRKSMLFMSYMRARVEVLMEPLVVGLGFGIVYVSLEHLDNSVAEVGMFLLILLRMMPLVKEMLRSLQGYLSSRGGLLAVDRLLKDLDENLDVAGDGQRFESLKTSIVYTDVTFRYGVGAPALDQVSFDIPARKMTAIVGNSGAGKSTVVDMLPRLREIDSGRIEIDGISISDYAVGSLREAISYVPQMPLFLDVTIAEHIRYGRPEASMEEIRRVARLANAAGFIEKQAEGYDAILGPNGSNLSGGQRQRVDLARALLRETPVLILDEPTSGLDIEAEAAFGEALQRIRDETDTTVVIVSHRLEDVAVADNIVVMENGLVTACGPHEMISTQDNWYARALKRPGRKRADTATL